MKRVPAPSLSSFTIVIAVLALCLTAACAQIGPFITQQPAGQTSFAGADVTLSVAVSGTGPFIYQWQFNGSNLPNNAIVTVAGGWLGDGTAATNASLARPSAVAVDASGNLFIADGNRIRKVEINGIITTVAGNGLPGYSGDGSAATNAILYLPSAEAVDATGNIFIADEENCVIRKMDIDGIIATVAGNGLPGYSGDGGAATNAGLTFPNGVAVDASGNLFIADGNRIRKVDINGIITTVAGKGLPGYSGDGSAATNAILYLPSAVAVDAIGNLFIADAGNYRIRKVDRNGIITTVGGGGTNYPGDGGAATNARLSNPDGVAVDSSGNLFIADGDNQRIRKVETNGTITTVAGNEFYGYYGDGGPATNASLTTPTSVAADAFGNLFIADGNRIRKVNPSGFIATVAGGVIGDGTAGTNASLTSPSGVAVDASGNLFIADTGNSRIRKVGINGVITTVAGNGYKGYTGSGVAAINASFNSPSGVAVDATGNLFIADTYNNRIRKVGTNGIITTVAGNGPSGHVGTYSGDDSAATNASLNFPQGVAVDDFGNLFIADGRNRRIRKVGTNGVITTVGGGGTNAPGDGGAATNASLYPSGVAVDRLGNLFISDSGNQCIRKVDVNGIITTVAGNGSIGDSGDGGAATSASLFRPEGVAVDFIGNFFFAEPYSARTRKVDPHGVISTLAGNGSFGYSGDGGAATNASLAAPSSTAVDTKGNVFIADQDNNRIRKVAAAVANLPSLTLNNVSASTAGDYRVTISGPYGSVTSIVATLTVVPPFNPNSTILMEVPVRVSGNLLLGFSATPIPSGSFTLLQAPRITGPWTTNTAAVLTTNAQTGVFQFSVPFPITTEFYQLRSP